MRLEDELQEGAVIVRVSGGIEERDADLLQQALRRHLDGGASRLVVDLSHAAVVSGAAFGALVRARARCQIRGGDLTAAAPAAMTSMLAAAGASEHLALFRSVSEAIGHVRRSTE